MSIVRHIECTITEIENKFTVYKQSVRLDMFKSKLEELKKRLDNIDFESNKLNGWLVLRQIEADLNELNTDLSIYNLFNYS